MYAAAGGSKKPDEDKWYHEAKLENDKVKVNTERLSEKEAVQKAKEGKNLFTLNEKLGRDVAEKATREGLRDKIGDPKIHKAGKPGYYPHYHLKMSGHRIHIWWDEIL